MTERLSQKLLLILILVLLSFILMLGIFTFFNKDKKTLTTIELDEVLNLAAHRINEIYQNALGHEELLQNPEKCAPYIASLSNIHPLYLKCNPEYLSCYFSGKIAQKSELIEVLYNDKKYNVGLALNSEGNKYEVYSRSANGHIETPNFALKLELYEKNNPKIKKILLLENTCKDIYLPWGDYSYGPIKTPMLPYDRRRLSESRELSWDNFGQHIFINKYLVTNNDVLVWKNQKNNLKNEEILNSNFLALPAVNLSSDEMKKFCYYRGEHLLEAHLFDAASFYLNSNLKDTKSQWRYPLPWESLTKLPMDQKDDFNNKSCRKIFSQSCKDRFQFIAYDNASTSLLGMNQILGGPLEFMRNIIDPELNLKASSYYAHHRSLWHMLTRRVKWDELGHESTNITWVDDLNDGVYEEGQLSDVLAENNMDIGFRCFHYGQESPHER